MTVLERLEQVVREIIGDESLVLSDQTTASDVPGWDSLAHINIMFALESEFDVSFSDDQLSAFRDVGQLRRFLETASGPSAWGASNAQ